MKSLLLSIIVASAAVLTAQPATAPANFADYRVPVYTGKTAPLVLTPSDRQFRTRLRWAATHQKVNFAGHYILTTWGCGGGCVMGAAIDAETGKIVWLPFTICCWPLGDNVEPLKFRADSRLIIFTGSRNEAEEKGIYYYKFERDSFTLLRTDKLPPEPKSPE